MLEPSNRPVTGLHFSSAFPPLSQNGSEYEDAYTAHRNSSPLNLDRNETNRYAQQCHDATWALAFALNRTITGKIVCLSLSVCLCQSALESVCLCQSVCLSCTHGAKVHMPLSFSEYLFQSHLISLKHLFILHIKESVDSVCRDGADAQYM